MREGAKQRLVSAVAIVALAVIFVPMLFERKSMDHLPASHGTIPPPPSLGPGPKQETFLGPGDSGVGGLKDSALTESEPLPLPPPKGADQVQEGSRESAAPPAEPNRGGRAAGPAGPTPPPHVAQPQSKESVVRQSQPVPVAPAPAPAPATSPKASGERVGSYVVQVAAVASPEAAAELEGKLRKGGFTAFVEKAEVNGKTYYRVRVGPELDRARADKSAAQLRERYRLDPFIQSYP
jgi:DedD protein